MTNYRLSVRPQQPSDDDDSFAPTGAILIDIVERDWPRGFDLGTAPCPVFLDHDGSQLRCIVRGAHRADAGSDLHGDILRPERSDESSDALSAVEAFLTAGRDPGVLDQVFHLGASRVMHEESVLTLTIPCADWEEVMGWTKDVRAMLPVTWQDNEI